MKNDRISIIVPVYNIAQDLPRCVDSILAQTYQNLEIILVDDGSPDDCGALCDAYAADDARVRVIHQENGGVTKARFAGIRAASGDWIGFVDGDDYIEPDMYERLLANALRYQADISHCGYQMVFPSRVDFYHNTGRLAQQDKLTGLKDLLDGSMIEPGLCNKLFHKTLFHSLLHSGVEEMGIRINEDLLMNYYLFQAAERSVYEDFCPYHYIVRAGSAANTRNRKNYYSDPIRVGQLLCEKTKAKPVLLALAQRYYVRWLIRASVQKTFPDLAKFAQTDLRALNKGLLPRKERYMALLVAYCCPLYRFVRWGYDKLTGADHKYDIT